MPAKASLHMNKFGGIFKQEVIYGKSIYSHLNAINAKSDICVDHLRSPVHGLTEYGYGLASTSAWPFRSRLDLACILRRHHANPEKGACLPYHSYG